LVEYDYYEFQKNYIFKICTGMGQDRVDRDFHGQPDRLTHITINVQIKVSEAKLPLRIR